MKKKILEAAAIVLTSGIIFTACRNTDFFSVKTERKDNLTEEVKNSDKAEDSAVCSEPETKKAQVLVHVCGAVISPGVYSLPEGSRIMDAVLAAGGMSDDADSDSVNLASFVSDGQQIRIPLCGEEIESDGKININTGSLEELCQIPGIGESRANQIIKFREENGMFARTEDLMLVPGIKEGTYQKISEYIKI